jgi:GntR family transcriptional repressor for pyruvate dehydrogenase complex
MSNLFEARDKVSAVDTVINRIKELLLERKLAPGEKLPSELEISDGLGISRGSVREAMKILSALGIVEIKVGDGTYISENPKRHMIDSLLFSFFIADPDITELSEFRKLFELDIVELIIQNYDKNVKERMELQQNLNTLRRMQLEKKLPIKDFVANDIEFHRILGKAAHNTVAERIYNFIIDFLEASIQITHSNHPYGEIVLEVHQSILDAIESKDISLIREAIDHSVDTWSDLQQE